MKRLIIIIPAYNEEKNLGGVIKGIPKDFGLEHEIIVVDDGSKDRTAEIARENGVIVVSHGRNLGYGAALKTGFEKAMERGADVVAIIDGDAQHYPSELKKVIEPVKDGRADFVIGSRFITYTKIPFYRRIGIKTVNLLFNLLAGTKITDTQSGFRAFSKEVIANLKTKDTKMGFSIETLFHIAEKKYKIVELPIRCDYSPESHKVNPVVQGMQLINAIVRCYFRRKFRK